jgi:hypothetical protein
MNLVMQTLNKSLRPPKPYLFYGPSFSGKKTAIRAALESLYIRPIVLTMDEAKAEPGKLGYIIYLEESLVCWKDHSCWCLSEPHALGSSFHSAGAY